MVYNETVLIPHADNSSSSVYANIIPPHYLDNHYELMIAFATLISTVGLIGTVGNIMVIIAVFADKFLRQPGNIFIASRAAADLAISAVLDPLNAMAAISGYQMYQYRPWLCQLIGSICVPVCTASLFNQTAIAINRHQSYSDVFTWRSSIRMCAVVWLCAVLVMAPLHLGWSKISYDPNYYYCSKSTRVYGYLIFWLIVAVLTPTIIMTFCYWRIYVCFRSTKHNLGLTTKPGGKMSALAKESASKRISKQARDERRLISSIFSVLLVSYICWGPYVLLLSLGNPSWIPGWIYVVTITSAHANSAINPVVFAITNNHFRRAFACMATFRWHELGSPLSSIMTSSAAHAASMHRRKSSDEMRITLTNDEASTSSRSTTTKKNALPTPPFVESTGDVQMELNCGLLANAIECEKPCRRKSSNS